MLSRMCIGLIRVYQVAISPWLPASCRFYPCCSEYAIDAFSKKGLVVGMWLTVKRLAKCNPFNSGGHDPVV